MGTSAPLPGTSFPFSRLAKNIASLAAVDPLPPEQKLPGNPDEGVSASRGARWIPEDLCLTHFCKSNHVSVTHLQLRDAPLPASCRRPPRWPSTRRPGPRRGRTRLRQESRPGRRGGLSFPEVTSVPCLSCRQAGAAHSEAALEAGPCRGTRPLQAGGSSHRRPQGVTTGVPLGGCPRRHSRSQIQGLRSLHWAVD